MKTQSHKHLLQMLFLAVLMVVATACPKDNKRAANPAYPPGVPPGVPPGFPPGTPCTGPGCVQSPGTGPVIAQALGRVGTNQMELGLTFFTVNSQPVPPDQYYQGQAAAQGVLHVATPPTRQFCPIPPGTYNIRTITPANWQGQRFYDLRLVAEGPTVLNIILPSNQISAVTPSRQGGNGVMYPYRLSLSMFVETVAGVSCYQYGMNFGEFVLQ